jgi:polysaccharide export outer membrane protein
MPGASSVARGAAGDVQVNQAVLRLSDRPNGPVLADPAKARPLDGCSTGGCPTTAAKPTCVPTELQKLSHPEYMIEPPDILLIDTIRLVPKPPYLVHPLDQLLIRVTAENLSKDQPIDGLYVVGPDGSINLGFSYGVVRVAGLSIEQAEASIKKQVGRLLKDPQVAVGLGQFSGVQQVRGEHLVRSDGTISLGTYGSVYVTGLTIYQAKQAIERHLLQFVQDPEVAVDVFAYNSKAYYIIADGGGYGQSVIRYPITGNETVLDAISRNQGLPPVSSTKRIWVARPAPADHCCTQILPVDWNAITQGGSTATNYQLFPGDRIYIHADPLIRLDNAIAKIISPFERLFGVTLLAETTVRSFGHNNNNTTPFVPVIP